MGRRCSIHLIVVWWQRAVTLKLHSKTLRRTLHWKRQRRCWVLPLSSLRQARLRGRRVAVGKEVL
jgi:hypothetical protein